jgi:hypothetical protein
MHSEHASVFPGVENADLWKPGWQASHTPGVSAHAPAQEASTRGARHASDWSDLAQRHPRRPTEPGRLLELVGHVRQTQSSSNSPASQVTHASRWFTAEAFSTPRDALEGSRGSAELPPSHVQCARPRGIVADELPKLFTGHGRHWPGGPPNPMFVVERAGLARLAQ